MRFIPTFCLQEGMLLGKSIYSKDGTLLLKEGLAIKEQYIDKVIGLGIQGVYIEDHISEAIEIKNVINDELRLEAVRKIKDLFIDIEAGADSVDNSMSAMSLIVEDIVNELVDSKNIMVNMVDIKLFDDYTFFHSVNVAILSIIVGISLDLNKEELANLGMGALLHDVGKVFIHKDCLNKQGKLTDDEFEQMKRHPVEGYRYIRKNFDIPLQACLGVLHHHEKYDGTGYPHQKAGKDISLFGRIIAIADVYDAITSDRPYRRGILPSKAMEYIMGGSSYHFDYELISIFISKVAAYPLGTCVKLSNGVIGIVVENYSDASSRPKLRLINDIDGEVRYVNLREDFNNNNLTIVDIVDM